MRLMKSLLLFLVLLVASSVARATVFFVTPSSPQYPTPCAAMYSGQSTYNNQPIAQNGDTVEIDYANGAVYTEPADANHSGRSDCKIVQDNLTIVGVNGRPIIDGSPSTGPLANTGIYYQKGIFDLYGHSITISNLEIRGATNSIGNGNNGTAVMINSGGISGNAIEGGSITIENCYIHDNNDGVRSTANTNVVGAEYYNTGNASTPPFITLQYDELSDNGNDCVSTSCAHNMYIGADTNAPPLGTSTSGVTVFNMYYSWSHDAYIGHTVKDRNAVSNLYYNLIGDAEGNTSNVLDFPLGGSTYIVGNVLYKTIAVNTPQNGGNANKDFMTWADVGDNGSTDPEYGTPYQDLHVINNTVILDPSVETPSFVVMGCQDASYASCGSPANGPAVTTAAVVENNIFIGPSSTAINQTSPVPYVSNNLILANNSTGGAITPGTLDAMTNGSNVTGLFVDATHFNFNLKSTASNAIGQGLATPTNNVGAADSKAKAAYQYVQPTDVSTRAAVSDLGAYQYASSFVSPSGLTVTNSGPITTPGTGTITIHGLPSTISTLDGFQSADFWSENPSVIAFFSPSSSTTYDSGGNAGPAGEDGVGYEAFFGTGEVPSVTNSCSNTLAPVISGTYAGCPTFNGTLTTTFSAYAPSGGETTVPVDIYVDGEHLTTSVTIIPGAVSVSALTLTPDSTSSYDTTITLTNPPSSAINVTLSSSNNSSGYLAFPASVTVPSGSTTAKTGSEIGTLWGNSPTTEAVTLTATYQTSSASATITLTAPEPRHFYFPTTSVVGGTPIAFDTGYATDCPAAGCPYTVYSSNTVAIPTNQVTTVQGGPPTGYADPPGSGSTGYYPSTLITNTVTTSTNVTLTMFGNGYNCTTVTCPTAASQVVTLTPPGAGVAVAVSVSSGNNQSTIIGTTFTSNLVALVTDINSNPVANVPVTFAGTGALLLSGTTANTNASGLASIQVEASALGSETVTASAPYIGTPATFTETGTAGTGSAASIAISSGSGQFSNVGTNFASPLVAIVKNSTGVAVSGATVTFASPSATFPGGATATTNSSGLASVTVDPTQSGTITVSASTAGVGTPASFIETAYGAIWTVGPGMQFAEPCEAVHAASPGDIIEISYNNGVIYQDPLDPNGSPTNGSGAARNDCVWYTNGLTIEGVGGRPIIDGTGQTLQKGLFNPRSANNTFINLELRFATCGDNCAGVRQDAGTTNNPAGGNLTVQYCYIHDNEDGILTPSIGPNVAAPNPAVDGAYLSPNPFITYQNDEFYNNGGGDTGYTHNLYVGADTNLAQVFTLENSWSHDSMGGHTVKDRGPINYLYYNLIGDAVGNTSYVLNFPQGGTTYLVGNTLYKVKNNGSGNGSNAFMLWADYGDNSAGSPQYSAANQDVHVINNTFLLDPNLDPVSYFVIGCQSADYVTSCDTPTNGAPITVNAVLENNIFVGPGGITEAINQPTAYLSNNLIVANNSTSTGSSMANTTNGSNVANLFVNAGAFNFNLASTATTAIGQGLATPTNNVGTADPKAKAALEFGNSGTYTNGGFASAPYDRPTVTDLGAFYYGTVSHSTPASIAVSSGSGQSAQINTNFTNPLVAIVKDASGNPVEGVTVTFAGTGVDFPAGEDAVTNAAGLASVTADPTATGAVSAVASVSGVSGTATFSETGTNGSLINTTTALVSSLNPSTYGASVKFTATVTPTAATGTVTFYNGGTSIGTGTLSSGVATLTLTTLPTGTDSITATYGGSSSYNGSTSSAVSQVVNKDATTTALVSSLNPSTYGASVKFTATVTPSTATGTVTFYNGGSSIGTGTLASGVATLTLTTLPVGTDSITATYAGDTNDGTSTSSAVSQVVNVATTSLSLTSSLNPSTSGVSVTFTATITPSAATGTVTFKDGGTTLGTGTLSGGVATYSTSTLAVGSHSITASYAATTDYAASTSNTVTQVVNSGLTSTTTTVASSLNPSTYGVSVTFTATVSPSAATGTVTFKDGATTLGTGTLSGGVATYSTSTLSVATHSITAVYGGNSSYSGSTSSVLSQVVNKDTTTTALVSSLNPSTYGASVTFTATVSPSTATGTVTFKSGATTLGTGTLSGGVATYTTTTLAVGTSSITAVYAGDTNDATSTSSAVSQVVNKATTTLVLTSSLNPSTYGAAVTFTATISPAAATGTITFKNGGTSIGTGTLSGGVATLTYSTLSVATHSMTATYATTTDYAASTSNTVSQVVNKAPTTLVLTSSPNPSTPGQSVTLTATITPSAATGTVTFKSGSTTLGTASLASGVATYSTTTLATGTDSLTASYATTTDYLASTSNTVSQVVSASCGTLASITADSPYFATTSVNFTAATTCAAVVTLSSSNQTILYIPASVTVPQGATTAETGSLLGSAWGQTPESQTATVTANYNGTQQTLTNAWNTLQIHAWSCQLTPCTVAGGSTVPFLIESAFGPAPVGGMLIPITSDQPSIIPNQSVTQPAGNGYFGFNVTTNDPATTTTVNVTITYNGIVGVFPVTVNH